MEARNYQPKNAFYVSLHKMISENEHWSCYTISPAAPPACHLTYIVITIPLPPRRLLSCPPCSPLLAYGTCQQPAKAQPILLVSETGISALLSTGGGFAAAEHLKGSLNVLKTPAY